MHRSTRLFLTAICCWLLVFTGAAVAMALPTNVPESAFEPTSGCGCHASFVQQWAQSMHAQALSDPVFRLKVEEANKATNGAVGPFCEKCHAPIAEMTGGLKSGKLSAAAAQGVQCTFCHQVTGTTKPIGNVSHTVKPDGTRRAQLKDPQAPHKAAYSEFHKSAEICGACHNVNHPGNGLHLEATYSEWLESPYAKEGTVCQDCHMSKSPGFVGPSTGKACGTGSERDNIYQMTFTGANVAQGNEVNSTKLLQQAAKLEMQLPAIVKPGASGEVTVTITNVGAGHMLPTGLTEVREMWLEVVAVGKNGESVVGERKFGTILKNAKGKYPAEVWDAVAIQSDDRIPPRGKVQNAFAFEMPAADETLTVRASLYYRSMPDELAKAAGVQNPVTTMASAEKVVFGSEAAMTAPENGGPTKGLGPSALYAILGMTLVAGIVIFFVLRGRRIGA